MGSPISDSLPVARLQRPVSKVLTGVLSDTLAQKSISKDQKTEINSWAGPLSAYNKK